MTYKGNNNLRTTLMAMACTLVVSTTCLIGAVGPATAQAAEMPAERGAAAITAHPIK